MIDLSPTKQKSPTIAIVTLIINKWTKHPIKFRVYQIGLQKNTQLNAAYMKYTSNVNKLAKSKEMEIYSISTLIKRKIEWLY